MKKITNIFLGSFLSIFLACSSAFAYNALVHSSSEGLIGGTGDALDAISVTNSDGRGHDLVTGDVAIVTDPTTDLIYFYTYDSTSSASELVPDVIAPDDAGATGRWILSSTEHSKVKTVYIEDPIVEDFDDILYFLNAAQIRYVDCKTLPATSTVTLNIENAAAADVLSADIVCDSGGQSACEFDDYNPDCDVDTIQLANDNMAARTSGNISISAVSTSPAPTSVVITVGYTLD